MGLIHKHLKFTQGLHPIVHHFEKSLLNKQIIVLTAEGEWDFWVDSKFKKS